MSTIATLAAVPAGTPFLAHLPPGRYYLGDPCYVFNRQVYADLHDVVFAGGGAWDVHLAVPGSDGLHLQMADLRTAHGDGRYPVDADTGPHPAQPRMGLSVDSGGLAVVAAGLCVKSVNDPNAGVWFAADAPFAVQAAAGRIALTFADGRRWVVDTDPRDDEDDDA